MENLNDDIFLIDAHCHFQYFDNEEIGNIITKSKECNITYFLTNSTSFGDFDRTLEIAKSNGSVVIPGIGHHPWYLEPLLEDNEWFDRLKKYVLDLTLYKVNFFIGEIGIDGGKPKK